jgi:hypothetical protein
VSENWVYQIHDLWNDNTGCIGSNNSHVNGNLNGIMMIMTQL